MSDRFVRQIEPRPKEETERPKRFSDFAVVPNIILVGDPGAGKSHMFSELAAAAGVCVHTARSFLNMPTQTVQTLFIDALDERRAGRSDRATVDLVVQKLFQVNAPQVRIACREHDWLGGTDLASFRPYFSQAGGVAVLSLLPLSEAEQIDLLSNRGIADPKQFIRDAESRGLGDYLLNPQNLIMLSDAVLQGTWPATRRELLEVTTEILLKEHNRERTLSGEGRYAVREVRPPASAACALRLISDVDGISLSEADSDPHFPSYRTIPFDTPELTLAALGRRTFRSVGNEAVDYLHRVNAEYAAAGWIAERIRAGLPFGRVRALIGVDGMPAPELRGLHAWLSILLPEYVDEIIDADPFGVLIYGDAPSLGLAQRVRLLRGLGGLAKSDPFFRPESRAPEAMAALMRPDMTAHLKTALEDPEAPFGLKALILDAMARFPPLVALVEPVMALLADGAAPYGLKAPALRAAVRMGPLAALSMVSLYKQLGDGGDDLRLRAGIMSLLYSAHFTAQDLSGLFNAVARSEGEIIAGALWQLTKTIPARQIPFVLDALFAGRAALPNPEKIRNRAELEHFVERLILRAFDESADGVTGSHLWNWLELRSSFRADYRMRKFEGLTTALEKRSQLALDMFRAALESYSPSLPVWQFNERLRQFLPFALSAEPLQWLASRVLAAEDDAEKNAALYELAFFWIYRDVDETQPIFEVLYELAEKVPHLLQIRDRYLSAPVEKWRVEDAQRAAQEIEKRKAGRLKNLAQFEKDIPKIRDGIHLGWMTWGADVYFSNFTDVDNTKYPRERLEEELGAENTAIMLEGLKAFLRTGTLPTLQEISEAIVNNSYPRLWLAFVAGMDEAWLETPTLAGLSDDKLKSLAAVDLVMPTSSRRENNTMLRDVHDWKEHLLKARRELVRDVYLFLAERGLSRAQDYASGLYELLNSDPFAPDRGQIAMQLLEAFPNAPAQRLEELVQVALTQSPRGALSGLVRKNLLLAEGLGEEQRRIWIVAGYLLEPESYREQLQAYAENFPSIVWRMRALARFDRGSNNSPAFPVRPSQLELMLRITAGHFENADFPSGGWSGDTNPWDAAEFVRSLVNALSADKSEDAARILQDLVVDPALQSYRNDVKHALANQRARLREMIYRQPDWNETIGTLSNKAPANVADLQALVLDHLQDIGRRIGTQNNDLYKQFWNEDRHSRPTVPKSEESARDVLLELLKPRLLPLGVSVEPEGHMVADKRADIVVALPRQKIIIELKRDSHLEVWTALETQLRRFYARDNEASGYGIYGFFWYGAERKGKIPSRGSGSQRPNSVSEMEEILCGSVATAERQKLRVVAIDVSIPDGQKAGRSWKRKSSAKNGLREPRKTGSAPAGRKKKPAKSGRKKTERRKRK